MTSAAWQVLSGFCPDGGNFQNWPRGILCLMEEERGNVVPLIPMIFDGPLIRTVHSAWEKFLLSLIRSVMLRKNQCPPYLLPYHSLFELPLRLVG